MEHQRSHLELETVRMPTVTSIDGVKKRSHRCCKDVMFAIVVGIVPTILEFVIVLDQRFNQDCAANSDTEG